VSSAVWEVAGSNPECGSGTFISCLPGKLAYFHDEEQENRWILRRRD
jgi:hypothetical protein